MTWCVLALLLGTTGYICGQPDLEKITYDLEHGQVEALRQLLEVSFDDALPLVRRYALDVTRDDIAQKMFAVLRGIPNVEQAIGDGIAERGNAGRIDYTINADFELLVKIGTPAAARQIGRFANSDVLLNSPSADMAGDSLRSMSAKFLSKFGFANAPTRDLSKLGMTDKEVEAWQSWWIDNIQNIDEAVKQAKKKPVTTPTREQTTAGQTISPQSKWKVAAAQTPGSVPRKVISEFSLAPVVVLTAVVISVLMLLLKWKRGSGDKF